MKNWAFEVLFKENNGRVDKLDMAIHLGPSLYRAGWDRLGQARAGKGSLGQARAGKGRLGQAETERLSTFKSILGHIENSRPGWIVQPALLPSVMKNFCLQVQRR